MSDPKARGSSTAGSAMRPHTGQHGEHDAEQERPSERGHGGERGVGSGDRRPAAAPLVGLADVAQPDWAIASRRVAEAGFWAAVWTLPTSIRVVCRLAWSTAPALTVVAVVVQVMSGCVTAFGLLATANVFTDLLERGPTPERVLAAIPSLALVAASYALRAGLEAAVSAVEGALRPRIRTAAEDEVTAALIGVDLLAVEDADFRELATQGGRHGVQALESGFRAIAEMFSGIIALVAATITAGLLNPWLAPVLLLATVAEGWATGRIAKLNHAQFLSTVARIMRQNVLQRVTCERDLALERHALCLQPTLLAEYRRNAAELMHEDIRHSRRTNWTRLGGRALAGIGTALAYLVLGLLLWRGQLPLALAGTAALAMRTTGSALSALTREVATLYEDTFHIEFYRRLMTEARARTTGPQPHQAPTNPRDIVLTDVTFTYPGQEKPALAGINLRLCRGETVALVGENGSGKTTLGKIITGLYPPTTGTVRWDDTDLATADPASVHNQIAVIAQHPGEWPMTAAHNITIGRLEHHDPAGEHWDSAITRSGATDVLADLPHGPQTLLSRAFSEGQDLSGGQWQRVGLARGLYRDAHVLVADEPTAALDAKAEQQAFTGLRHATTKRTTILVTHRLANIRTADRIIVLEHGRITDEGTHHQLITKPGLYHDLFTLQANNYLSVADEG